MKKKLVLLMMCLMMLGAGSAFAATPTIAEADPAVSEMVAPVKKFQLLKEFQDELHTINGLRVARLETKAEIIKKQDQTLDLLLAAKDNGNKEGLKKAAEIRKQIHAVNEELKGLWESVHAEMKAFRQAVKDRDSAAAQVHIDKVISLYGQINGKLAEKAGLYDQIIVALS
jgi:hypothetical protein